MKFTPKRRLKIHNAFVDRCLRHMRHEMLTRIIKAMDHFRIQNVLRAEMLSRLHGRSVRGLLGVAGVATSAVCGVCFAWNVLRMPMAFKSCEMLVVLSL